MKPDRDQSDQDGQGHRSNGDTGGATVAEPAPPSAEAVLDAVCRSVVRLAGTATHPPRRIRMQDGQTTVEVEWPDPVWANAAPGAPAAAAGPGDPAAEPAEDERGYVRAPMVGTFYHASAPDAPPYVRVGDVVRPGQPVGVLEAMKMMSTITAAAAGRVVEVLAPNAHPVEFDQPLIALAPVTVDAVDQP